MQSTSKLEQKTYDMNTITAADFTVEFDITKEMYDNFVENEYKVKKKEGTDELLYKGMSAVRAFKKELKTDVERELSRSLGAKLAKNP